MAKGVTGIAFMGAFPFFIFDVAADASLHIAGADTVSPLNHPERDQ